MNYKVSQTLFNSLLPLLILSPGPQVRQDSAALRLRAAGRVPGHAGGLPAGRGLRVGLLGGSVGGGRDDGHGTPQAEGHLHAGLGHALQGRTEPDVGSLVVLGFLLPRKPTRIRSY